MDKEGENKGEIGRTDKENKEINKEIEDLLINLVKEARTQVYKMILTTDKEEREKTREVLKEVLFDIGRVYIMVAFYSFLLELEDSEDTDKKKYISLEYKGLDIIKGLEFKD